MAGRLIVVEGLDGTGKSTASKVLADRLGARWTTTPCPTLRAVRAAFDSAFSSEPMARSLAYMASVITVGRDALRLRDRGVDVVVDRYLLSTLAYAPNEAVAPLSALEDWVVPADITFYLHAPLPVRVSRMGGRGAMSDHDAATTSRVEDARLAACYRKLASHPCVGCFVPVDASAGLDEVVTAMHARVNATVTGQLPLFEPGASLAAGGPGDAPRQPSVSMPGV